MNDRPPILIVLHGELSTPGRIGLQLKERGFVLDVRRPRFGDTLPGTLDDHTGVVIFGGPQSANDDDEVVKREIDWIGVPLDEQKPYLGVCLGAQMLARAAGATVKQAATSEVGWFEIELTPPGRSDSVLGALPLRSEAFQWHHYTFDVPAGADELARSEACTQAFRLGDACWGVQFHPEVTAKQLDEWTADAEDPPPDPERLRAETPAKIDAWNDLGRALCSAFLVTAERLAAPVA